MSSIEANKNSLLKWGELDPVDLKKNLKKLEGVSCFD